MIRQPIKPWVSTVITVLTLAVLAFGYGRMSASQHAVNPNDSTIPTFTQLTNGVSRILEKHKGAEDYVVGPSDLPFIGGIFPDEWRFPLNEAPLIGTVFEGKRWIVLDTVATLSRLLKGLCYGVFGALVLGVLMGCFAPIESAFRLMLSSFAKIPPTAMMAVFFVLVTQEDDMYPAMIGFGILPTLALATYLSVKDVPEELVYKAYTLGASNAEVIWDVIWKVTLPKMIDSIRLQIGPAMVFLIAAEMVVGDVGFGYRIRLQSRLLNMDVVYPYLVILMIIGFTMDAALQLLQRKMCPWYAPEKG